MEILKILGFIFISAVLCIILKSYRPEYALAVAVCCALAVLTVTVKALLSPLNLIEEKITQSGIDVGYFKIALKALGIGYVTSFIANACRDAGQNALAFKAELAGKCAVFILSAPLVLTILQTALGFVK